MEWIDIKKKKPNPDSKVIVFMNYTEHNRGTRIEIANTHWTDRTQMYGGPNSLTGEGFLTGLYFSIPAILAPGIVTHWMPIPSKPEKNKSEKGWISRFYSYICKR